jgi:NADH dehydrogenase
MTTPGDSAARADSLHRVVILGGGFGGLAAAKALARAPVRVTVVDRRNFHLFQPLLYQVATGGLSPADIAAPLRALLAQQRNARVLLAEATDLDPAARRVLFSDGALDYDSLIVACGAHHHYFGHPEWEPIAPGLKTLEDATAIRRKILVAFEAAEREPDPARRAAWLTFVLVGGGPTGVELAGALAEIARHTLKHDFRRIDPAAAHILLVEGAERILPPYMPALSARAERSLARLGVETRTRTRVTAIAAGQVELECDGRSERISARTVVWAAGVAGAPFGRVLAARAAAELDRAGRVVVRPDLTLPAHPEIFVVGDLASCAAGTDGKPLPGVAQVAMQQGRYAARVIARRARGGAEQEPPFRYRDYGSMAVIGRGAGIADFGWLRLARAPAWLVWLFVHLMALVDFENRLLVFIQWAWSYATWNRGARLITGESPLPLPRAASEGAPPDGLPARRTEH